MSDILTEVLNLQTAVASGVVPSVGFGSVLILGADSTLGGASVHYLPLTSADGVAAQLALGNLTAQHAATLTAAFAAQRRPATIYAGKWDKTGTDLPAVGFAAAQAAMLAAALPAPYWLGIDERVTADILSAIGWLTADSRPHVGIFQTSDGDAITTGYPAAFSTVEANSRKVLAYAPASPARYLDAEALAYLAATDPEAIATGGHLLLTAPGAALTDAQVDFARTNAIFTGRRLAGATAGNTPVREYELRTIGGANPFPLYLRVTVDYIAEQIRTAIASVVADVIAVNERFPGGVEGEGLLFGLIGNVCTRRTGTGTSAWLSPTPVFGGRSFDLALSWNATTRRFSGLLRVNVRGQIVGIDLTAIFGAFI